MRPNEAADLSRSDAVVRKCAAAKPLQRSRFRPRPWRAR